MITETPYDDVFYPTGIHQSASVDRLFVMGTIFGTNPVPLQKARVLEIGCGDGMHILPFAYEHPESKVTGLDYAITNINKANEYKEHLKLENIEFVCKDIQDVQPDFGEFDYIIVHGLYAWVPQPVKDAIMSVCKNNLAKDGIAFISYNTMPGGHVRLMIREMMMFHANQFTSNEDKVREARAMIYFLAKTNSHMPTAYKHLLTEELKRVAMYPDSAFLHDDLGDVYTPVSFTDFMNHAFEHDLMFLSEADFVEMNDTMPNDEIANVFSSLHKGNLLLKEQYLDYMRYRRFRQTLLVHTDKKINRIIAPNVLKDLYVSANLEPEDSSALDNEEVVRFKDSNGMGMATSKPFVKHALMYLNKHYPKRFSPTEISMAICDKLAVSINNDLIETIEDVFLRAYSADVIEVYAHKSNITDESTIPNLWGYAKKLIQLRNSIPTQNNTMYHVMTEAEKFFLLHLDGSKTVEEVMVLLQNEIDKGNYSLPKDETVESLVSSIISTCKRIGLFSN